MNYSDSDAFMKDILKTIKVSKDDWTSIKTRRKILAAQRATVLRMLTEDFYEHETN